MKRREFLKAVLAAAVSSAVPVSVLAKEVSLANNYKVGAFNPDIWSKLVIESYNRQLDLEKLWKGPLFSSS